VDPEDLNRIWPYDRAEAVYIYRLVGGGVVHEVRYFHRKKKKKDSMFVRPTEWGLIYGLKDKEYYRRGNCWFYVNDKTPADAERKSIAGAQVQLYRPEVLARARKGEDWVFLVEGPKDAETAIELGLYATTAACGANGLRSHQAEELRDHLVAVVGDHDNAGKQGAANRARMLSGVAREVRVLPALGGEPGSGYDLTDFFGDRRREGAPDSEIARELLDLVAKTQPSAIPQPTRPFGATLQPSQEKTTIPVTTDEEVVNDAALEAVARSAANLYQRCGSLVHVVQATGSEDQDEEMIHWAAGSPLIRIMPEAVLRQTLSEHCRFVKVHYGEDDQTDEKPVHPPQWTTRNLLARGQWDSIQILMMAVEGPVLRRDGTVLQDPGYDRRSGILYAPNTRYEQVPESPTRHQVEAALELLREVVCDFPFKEESHFAAWLSALLTPLARFTFKGPSPLNLIDANIRGAGKSLLADVCNMIVTGRPAARMSYTRNEDELRKAITSLALSGAQVVLIDNIRGFLGDATLDRALTATTWQDRLLGGNVAVELPLNVTWYATGNNVTLTADTVRRCLHIRLESPEEHPEVRSGFRHPRLLEWVSQERGKILPAALTLLRAWWVAGKATTDLSGWGSFEGWSDIVRQCIVWLGLPDPAETRDDLEEAADVEGVAVGSLILGLEELLDAQVVGAATASEITAILERASADEFRSLREAISELLPRLRPGQLPTGKQLGYLFRKHRGKYVQGACLTDTRENSWKGTYWKVHRRTRFDLGRQMGREAHGADGARSLGTEFSAVDGADGVDDPDRPRKATGARFSGDLEACSSSSPSSDISAPISKNEALRDDSLYLRGNEPEGSDSVERGAFPRRYGTSSLSASSLGPDRPDDDRPPY
jgi:hypothetical protein